MISPVPMTKIKSYLNLKTTEHDALLLVILERTIDYAETFLGSPIKRREVSKIKDVHNFVIWLHEIDPDVRKVERLVQGVWEEIEFFQEGSIIKIYGPLRKGQAKVTMDAGFQDVPSGLEFAIVKEVAYEFLQSLQAEGRLGKSSISDSLGNRGVSTTYSKSEFVNELKLWKTR